MNNRSEAVQVLRYIFKFNLYIPNNFDNLYIRNNFEVMQLAPSCEMRKFNGHLICELGVQLCLTVCFDIQLHHSL